jgi:hypothetical protein
MAITMNNDPKRAALSKQELWPLSQTIRTHLVQVALGMCGLEVQADGQVTPIMPAEGKPPIKSRHKLSAMRLLARFDHNALELKRVEVAMEERGIEEKLDVHPDDGLPPINEEIAEQALILIQEETDKKKAARALEPEPEPDNYCGPPTPPEPFGDDIRWRSRSRSVKRSSHPPWTYAV